VVAKKIRTAFYAMNADSIHPSIVFSGVRWTVAGQVLGQRVRFVVERAMASHTWETIAGFFLDRMVYCMSAVLAFTRIARRLIHHSGTQTENSPVGYRYFSTGIADRVNQKLGNLKFTIKIRTPKSKIRNSGKCAV